MCELCDIQDRENISDEAMLAIVRTVEAHEKAHLDHTILSIFNTLGVQEVTITAETAQAAAEALEEREIELTENLSANFDAMTYKAETPKRADTPTQEALRPLQDGEVSEQNSVAALFKALGLEF